VSAETLDLITGWASLVLTLFIFSYLLGDNFLYRIAVHMLVGGIAGYATIVVVEGVVVPWINLTIMGEGSAPTRSVGLIPFVVWVFLVLKLTPRLAYIGNIGMAFVIGVGAGVAVVGAVDGTVIPLVRATGASVDDSSAINAVIAILGTISTLIYFQYLGKRHIDGTVGRSLPMRLLAWIGQVTIAITFGAIYAGAVLTSLAVFSGVLQEQISFLLEQIG